jgi:hypothetical protein
MCGAALGLFNGRCAVSELPLGLTTGLFTGSGSCGAESVEPAADSGAVEAAAGAAGDAFATGAVSRCPVDADSLMGFFEVCTPPLASIPTLGFESTADAELVGVPDEGVCVCEPDVDDVCEPGVDVDVEEDDGDEGPAELPAAESSANAILGAVASAIPTPNATANPPTRPM